MAKYVAILFFLAVLGIVNAVLIETPIEPASEQNPINGDVRLVDGETVNCGRVEVFYDGEWGTVCDDRWSLSDGDVVCRQLGYTAAESVHRRAYFGQGQGPIWLDNVGCRQTHQSISECVHNGWGVHNCKHKEDAGVCCVRLQPPKPLNLPVRLRCPECNEGGSCNACPDEMPPSSDDCQPQVAVRGIVEVEVNGQWGPVSAEGWGMNEATVVCGQLGYPMAYPSGDPPPTIQDIWPDYSSEGSGTQCDLQSLTETDSYRRELTNTHLQGVDCLGKEYRLLDCYFSGIGLQQNPSSAVAVVQCGSVPNNCERESNKTYRLRGGAVPWSGRVEVKMNGEWGTVCDAGFDAREGNIICRDLGYGTVKHIISRAGYGRGVGKIHLSHIDCTGSELKIEDCPFRTGNDAEYCGHQGDVGIECNVPDKSQCPLTSTHSVKMWQHVNPYGVTRTYPQIMGPGGFGLLCYSNKPMVDVHAGRVICRQTMGQFVIRISRGDLPTNYRGSYYNGFIVCTGDEASLSECVVRIRQYQCSGGYIRVDCSPAAPDLVPDLFKLRLSLESRYYVDRLPLYTLSCAAEERCLSSSAYTAYGLLQNGERHLLRFDSHTWNFGISDFLPVDPRSEWQWHSCHNHYHSMETFVEYDLLNSETGVKVAEGHKASFCLEDSECVRGYYSRYSCSTVQGISVNCGDLYPGYLDCQWIDITGVPAGNYIVRQIVNPQHLVVESDYRNNAMSCNITLKAIQSNLFAYDTHDCWLSDHEGTSTSFY